MIENNNFPWYLQLSPTFKSIYDGFFDVAVSASPLDFGKAFSVDEMKGAMLYRLGTYWGMSGSPYIWDGLIYDLDNWSESKNWTGGIKDVGEKLYANMIKAKAYAYGRPYCLETLKGVFERLFDGYEYEITVDSVGVVSDPDFPINKITINLSATREVIESFIEMRAFDLTFIGHPTGIQVTWNYIFTN